MYWDYPHKEWYEYYLDYYSEYYPQDDQSITESVNSFGAASWDGVDAELMPEHLGVNYIELSAPEYSEMELGIVGDEVGDQSARLMCFSATRGSKSPSSYATAAVPSSFISVTVPAYHRERAP